jgi:hypothetical protein
MIETAALKKITVRYLPLEFIEIAQFSIILFIFAIFISFIVSSVFIEIDKYNSKTYEINSLDFKFALSFTLLFQFIIVSYLYYKSIVFVKQNIISFSSYVSNDYHSHKTIESALHIVLILLLKEMNTSLGYELHEFSNFIKVNH